MQWDEHDSIKYQNNKKEDCIESKSMLIDEKVLEQEIKNMKLTNNDENNSHESNRPTEKKVENKTEKDPNRVEVMILKGWNPNLM